MKKWILTLGFLISASAFANPFDTFLGNYKVVGSPHVRIENAKFCNRFNFKNVSELAVVANSKGHKQSHLITLSTSTGWSSHPIMDFDFKNQLNPTMGSFAKTSGGKDSATNEWGQYGAPENDVLSVTMKRQGNQYSFVMNEERLSQGRVVHGCYYSVDLQR